MPRQHNNLAIEVLPKELYAAANLLGCIYSTAQLVTKTKKNEEVRELFADMIFNLQEWLRSELQAKGKNLSDLPDYKSFSLASYMKTETNFPKAPSMIDRLTMQNILGIHGKKSNEKTI